jgi:hypothetical protein
VSTILAMISISAVAICRCSLFYSPKTESKRLTPKGGRKVHKALLLFLSGKTKAIQRLISR